MHKSKGSQLFLLLLFSIAATCATLVFVFSKDSISVPFTTFLIIYAASAFYVLYQVCVSKAYQLGEISRLYPLTVLSPVFVPLWAIFFLGEQINLGIAIGIGISTFGAIIVKQTSFAPSELWSIFSRKNMYKGAGFALMASLMYSIGSVFDKAKIAEFSLIPYLWVLLCCMAGNMLLYSLIFERASFSEIRTLPWKRVLFAGILGYASFFTFRYALQHIDVSIAVPLRTSSILFAVLLGIFFAQESFTKQKFIGVSTIILGIVMIQLSA
jgi:drug/metabolite transporter (DMT)-like permease